MTSKQILDSFSETLMQDGRILSAQERELLRNLVHHARSASLEPHTHEAVNATIASAVGETVAQRAFSVLGASIVERILESSGGMPAGFPEFPERTIYAGNPNPPGPPQSPPGPPQGPPGPPQGPRRPADIPPGPPQGPPRPTGPPGPPQGKITQQPAAARTALLEREQVTPIRCVVLDEFLAPQELRELTVFTLEHEADFCASEIVSHGSGEGAINEGHRRSRVLLDLGKYQDLMVNRIKSVLPLVRSRLGLEEFSIAGIEAQITASNEGDFFHCHSDNSDEKVASRELTFVYFFHREPRQFSGGELRIHGVANDGEHIGNVGGYQSIVPQQNQIVFFPCSVQHEITRVECPSGLFADSRFTMNGWLHK